MPIFGPCLQNFSIVYTVLKRWLRVQYYSMHRQCIEMACQWNIGLELELEIKETIPYWCSNRMNAMHFDRPLLPYKINGLPSRAWNGWCSDKQMFSHQHAFQVIAKYHLEFTTFLTLLYSVASLGFMNRNQLAAWCMVGIMCEPPPMYVIINS